MELTRVAGDPVTTGGVEMVGEVGDVHRGGGGCWLFVAGCWFFGGAIGCLMLVTGAEGSCSQMLSGD